jgi:hypothetical protein
VQNETEIITGFSTLTTEATSIVSTTAYVTEEEFNNTGVSQTSFTLVSSVSTTITSLESTQTEEGKSLQLIYIHEIYYFSHYYRYRNTYCIVDY